MSCVPKNELLSKILPLTNNDVRRATEYLATIEDAEFSKWYKDITGKEFDATEMTTSNVNAVIAFNNRNVINTQDYIQKIRTSRTGLFGDDVAKEDHAINILSTMLIKAEGAINKKVAESKKNKEEENKERTTEWVKKLLIGQLQRHKKANGANLTSDQIAFIDTVIINLYDGGNFNNNILFDLVINSPEVISLSKQFGVDENEDIDIEADSNENTEQDSRTDVEVPEITKADWSELSDQRKNVDKNVSKDVKEWFGKLSKTKSNSFVNGKPDVDTDTYSGIPESVPFANSFKVINNYANFSNVESFVNSLHAIAARFKDASHLENAAKLLEDKSNESMRNKIFVQLKQTIWQRNEMSERDGKITVNIKNRNTFPKLNLLNKILNSFDKFVYTPSIVTEDSITLSNISNRINSIKNVSDETIKNSEIQQISEELSAIINRYNFGITRESVLNYISGYSADAISNINSIISDLEEFIKVVSNASETIARNNAVERAWYKEEYKKQSVNPDYKIVDFDRSSLTSIDGTANKIADRIANRFKDYQIVENEFNSINAENNLVSDILKNNYIGRFFERVNNKDYNDNPTANEEFKDYLLKFLDVPAYRNTNILIEQKLSNGQVIPGFLRLTETGYELTPYYREFGFELFNGIRNEVTNKSKSYKDINALEWDIVTLNEFANAGDSFEITKGVRRAKYFTQTPSDAPKTFVFNSYKLNIEGLSLNGNVNRNHAIYKSFLNSFQKELNAMAQAIDYLFVTNDVDGIVTLGDKLVVKDEFKDLRSSNAKLNYHYKKGSILKNGKPTGNVFQFRSLLIDKNDSSESRNLNSVFGEDGLMSLLYGGSESKTFIRRNENNELEIVLDNDTLAKVYNYIDGYIKYRVREGITQYGDKKQYVDKYKNASDQEFNKFISEMVLNYEIQYANLNDMFFGDEAFYKDSRDTIKRNKEYQAGGLSYAAYNLYNKDFVLNDGIKIGNKIIPITSTFKYITLEDVQSTGSTLSDIKKQLKEAGVSKESAAFILKQFSKDRSEVTDAQSFITLDEFVRRIYLRGEYDNYKDVIEALYDESKPIEGAILKDISKFVQVQKNFYYDLEIEGGLVNPIQIKNAEFVLIPRFLGNTELGALAKMMNDNGISQVNFTTTEKATTSKVLKLWDSEGNFPRKEELASFSSSLQTHYKTGYYSNLYTQQDVPQHMDGENKAGLQIVKKLIDNISNTPEGQNLIKDFFDCFTANIQDSFNDAASRIGVEINNKGEIIYDGETVAIDNNKFIALIKDELTRRGLDSNYRKYAEINPETGLPYMPAWSNLIRSKLESIVNSIFTNNVTRQTLKGFHASQVANIGMTELGESLKGKIGEFTQSKFEEKHGYRLGRKLNFHKDGSQIIEILLPKWQVKAYNTYDAEGNLVKEVTLEDLQKAGLDIMIGYRIPTEGKQSIGIMKVVGLLDETQGSTIVVPDDWVLQTGADFDIDSIYGIYHAAYFDKEGKPHKVEYIDGDDEISTYRRYIGYVNSLIDRETRKATSSEFTKEEFKEARKAARETVRKANEEYDKFLTNQVRDLIAETDETWAELPREVKDNLTITFKSKELKFGERVDAIVSKMDFYENEYKDNEAIAKFAQQYRNIQSIINEQREFYQNVKDNAEQLAIDYADETRRARLEETINARAEIVGAMSLEEFSKLTVAQQNTRDARNNKIVDTFIKIMNLPVSIGENLSSSNFEDIKNAKTIIFGNLSEVYHNINSVIAQNWYRDANMSGARLKAISVNHDNFVSISNKAKTTIEGLYGGFKFTYSYTDEAEAKKKLTILNKRFGKQNVKREGNTITVNHNMLGWSYDNLNIDDRLLTPYSSETTALILDGVKEGGVPNVDLYTFDVYKSIVNCGANYETSIRFINQPIITELINRQNANDNVFGEQGFNPITTVRRDLYIAIAKANGRTAKKTDTLDSFKKYLESIGIDENEFLLKGMPVKVLKKYSNDSFKNGIDKVENVEDLITQLKVLNVFEHYKNITDQVNSNMRVITSDKFGAGKSVNEIDQVLKRIREVRDKNFNSGKTSTNPVLTSDYGTYLINAIYPRTSFRDINEVNSDKSESAYPSLYYQLKYSCIATKMIIQDSGIFKTQTPAFKSLVNAFDVNSLKTIQRLESFIVNLGQAQSTFVNTNRFITKSTNEFIPSYNLNLLSSQEDIRSRLYGYVDIVGKFDISDLSEANVERFMKLSPANKVAIMQSVTSDNNLFKNLNVEYRGRRNSKDQITIIDSTISTEAQYQMFRNAWNSDNPFIKLTAMDLVRYGIVVEGYSFKGGSVSKIIPAELLYTEDNGIDSNNGLSTGTGIILDSEKAIDNLIKNTIEETSSYDTLDRGQAIDELKDIFFRSNPNLPDVYSFENKKYKNSPRITFNQLGSATISIKEARLRKIVTGSEKDPVTKSYIKTNMYQNTNESTLFKVINRGSIVDLIPLNKLEDNEIADVSINPENNRFLPVDAINKSLDFYYNSIPAITQVSKGINSKSRKFLIIPSITNEGSNLGIADVLNAIVLTSPVKKSSNLSPANKYVISSSDNKTIIDTMNQLEEAGVKDYTVVVPNTNFENIRVAISNRNNADLVAERERIANAKLEANEVQLRTKRSDNSESPYYTQLKTSINQTLSDVKTNGIAFVPVLQSVIDNTGLRSGGMFRYSKEGTNYVVTNLGRVTSKSIKLTHDYLVNKEINENGMLKLVYPRRVVLEQVVKQNQLLDKFSNNNILRVQTEEAFQNEDVLESALIDNDKEINDYIAKVIESIERNNANVQEDALTDAFRSFNTLDLRANNASKLNDNMREQALKIINGYTNRRIDDFLFDVHNFVRIENKDGKILENISITNKKLFDMMLKDEALRTRYEMFLDDINRFISDYSIIESLQPYNIDEAMAVAESQEEIDGMRRTNEVLKQLKDKFTRISALDNTLKRSTKMYFDTYISSLTNDPRIKSGMLEITAAIEDENFFQYYLADSQETHIPIVQIVLKKMMQELRKAEINARDKKIAFTSEVSKIIEEANKNGVNVSLNDILDENGNLLLPYNQTFLDTLQTLKDNLKLAQIKDENGRNGIEYKKAADALEKFLIDNVERQYVKDMYQDYFDLNKILDKYPKTYIKLKKLMQEEGEILSTITDNDYSTLTPQNAARLEEILSEIQDMRSTIDELGNYRENYHEANAVNNYFTRRKQLNTKYKETKPKQAFEERYKQAIANLQYPSDSETYREAAAWLDANTNYRLSPEFIRELNDIYKQTKRGNPITGYILTMFRGKYDKNGIIDGTRFNSTQVENIKKHEEQMLLAAKNRIAEKDREAQAWINERIEWRNTPYYENEYVKANQLGKEGFEKWYNENHVFNPLTNEYEPLMIWRQRVVKDEACYMEYTPKSKWLETKVRKQYLNPKFVDNKLQPSTDRYTNDKYYAMNNYQQQLYSSVTNLLDYLVKDKRSRAYINKGYLPNQAIEKEDKGFKDYWQDFKRSHGWYDAPNKSDIELNLYKRFSNAPMLHSLSQVKLLPIRDKQEGETKEDYIKYVEETLAANRELHRQRMEETKERNNPNVLERLNSFIDQMYLFNSRNDASRLAKITINQLRNMDFIKRAPNNEVSSNRLLSRITGKEELRTFKNENANITKHFESQVRKLIFNEFELDEGTRSKVSRVLRNMVSSKFMMLNLTGGIANVLYGKTQIQMEMAAGQYFKYSDFRKAENEYALSIGSYFADAYSETTKSETNAIIRLFNILESDMATETYGKGSNPLGKLEDLLFIQQSAGEHYMQNTTLLAMLNSHRVSVDENGKAAVISYETFTQNLRENSLIKVLNEVNPDLVNTYNEYRNKIKESFAVKEQFNRFKQDMITNFLRTQSKEVRDKFVAQYKEDSKEQRSKFDELPTFRSQLKLSNGVAVLKEDSPLSNADIADFRNKVLTVNHHIHGIYDKIGANTLQQSWWGALLMQFHKHLVPGFQKRFGYRLGHFDGVYNETRETINKGSYVSLAEFITFPVRKYYELNNSNELEAVRTLQGLAKGYVDFFGNFVTYYNILPEYDKANLRRCLGEWIAITKAVALFVVGKLMLDDDDESTQIADYVLYSADRLMSETIQYNPWGMMNEGQKLYSQPVAAFSIANDNLKLLGACCSYIFTGDADDLLYQSGTYSGENKLKVNLLKQVPVVNQIRKHERLGANNSYYKVRQSPFSGLGQFIANKITGEED
jgi:hypothetical protein